VSRARWATAVVVSAAAVTGLTLVQSDRTAAGKDASECACAGTPIVDGTLLAFLSKARAAHHRADLTEEDGDLDLAVAALEPVVALPHPAAPEAVEVVADTYARLADLKSELGDFEPALRDVDAGLALAARPTHFRGHLLEIEGVVLERRYRALEAMGETDAAARLKARALEAFQSAIEVQDQVIGDALGDAGR
jgi:tetratricopeptide (TPR) repeat protein